ncbi:MAG: carbohydrate kinase family protein [Chloroflexota bacterium]|nr:carbohydrate kinase family protein [Chloroflexota bacterium]
MVVIGDATLDVHVLPMRPMVAGSDVPAEIQMRPGGQGANVAVRLARQGVSVTLVCALADDAAGRVVRTALAEDGVSVEALSAEATGVIVVIGDERGERSMLSHRAPIPRDVTGTVAGISADWLLVSGYALLQPDAMGIASGLAALSVRRVLLGCAVPDDALQRWRAVARELRADLVIANREEVAAARLEDLGAVLAVTDPNGAEAAVLGQSVRADASTGPPAVDTTGAGDAFAAAFAAALAHVSWPPQPDRLRTALERGVTLASDVVRVRGAQSRVAGERPSMLRS